MNPISTTQCIVICITALVGGWVLTTLIKAISK